MNMGIPLDPYSPLSGIARVTPLPTRRLLRHPRHWKGVGVHFPYMAGPRVVLRGEGHPHGKIES